MKLLKTESPYLDKDQWRKVFLAMSIMTLILYTVAMVFSLCGSKYFILNYQNEQMDKIESFMREHKIITLIQLLFSAFEFYIIFSFEENKLANVAYPVIFYAGAVLIAVWLPNLTFVISYFYPLLFYLFVPLIKQLVINKKIIFKEYLKTLLRLVIAIAAVFVLQVMIYVIKAGYFSVENHIMSLSTHFMYAIEYDIALSVILFTVYLFINREKGDSKLWVNGHTAGSSSQTSKMKSQRLNLTKTQKNKLRLFFIKFYAIQLGSFLLLMVLPFLLGKVFEFLVMYAAFAVTRFLLGFKYSLHYKKEWLCITVGAVVFGILSLAVPFFYIVMIISVSMGVGLAILLHLSYKYKGFYMFNMVAKPDKFAELYVLMDGNLDPHHVEIICKHRCLNKEQTKIILLLAEGNKKSYIAKQMNYEVKTIERRINDALDILNENT